MSKLYLIKRPDSPVPGATRNEYFYGTEYEGSPWLAEVDEDVMFEPDTFEIDPDPCGIGFKDNAKLGEYLRSKAASEVGFVKDGNLHITKDIVVETGWGGFGGEMIATSHEIIKATRDITELTTDGDNQSPDVKEESDDL